VSRVGWTTVANSRAQSETILDQRYQDGMRFDDDAASLAGRADSVQADGYLCTRERIVPLMELGNRRRLKKQVASKFSIAQDDAAAISRDQEGTSQRLDGKIHQYRFQKFRLYDKSARASWMDRCVPKTHCAEDAAGGMQFWSRYRAVHRP